MAYNLREEQRKGETMSIAILLMGAIFLWVALRLMAGLLKFIIVVALLLMIAGGVAVGYDPDILSELHLS